MLALREFFPGTIKAEVIKELKTLGCVFEHEREESGLYAADLISAPGLTKEFARCDLVGVMDMSCEFIVHVQSMPETKFLATIEDGVHGQMIRKLERM